MPKYLVFRTQSAWCQVEAIDEEAAIRSASALPADEWRHSVSANYKAEYDTAGNSADD